MRVFLSVVVRPGWPLCRAICVTVRLVEARSNRRLTDVEHDDQQLG
jgi:hypothetical protein